MSHTHGVDSEVGRLRTVLVHRPGAELKRLTPRGKSGLLLHRLPWVERAQQEHDIFSQALRDHGVEVLYVTELLQDALEYAGARAEAIDSATADCRLGEELRAVVRGYLDSLDSELLAQALIAGITPGELRGGRGLVYELLDRHDLILDPLPNLVFTRDSSVWIGDQVVVASPAGPARRREAGLLHVLYRHHPRFTGTTLLYGPDLEPLDGGDILVLAPGVIAAGVGDHTCAAAVERLASRLFRAGLAHTVLAVPLAAQAPGKHLDEVCTVIDGESIVMYPGLAYALNVHTVTQRAAGLLVSRPQPFLEAAAQAMGIGALRVIETGLDPLTAPRGYWDDGSNTLALGRGVAVCDERNAETSARLERAGVAVIVVPASELGSVRGGPRCFSCAVARDPALIPAQQAQDLAAVERLTVPARHAATPELPPLPRPVPAVSNPPGPGSGGQPAEEDELVRAR
ncbi:MAG TPA: arginine deiminase [Streptosporangiaceae bacterium]|nr:arginine deiminase [Streptosporangiaceae bacterium]